MKSIYAIALLLFFGACSKKTTTNDPINEPVSPTAMVITKGSFIGTSGHTVSGSAEIITENNQKKLVLKGFSTTAGPDLRVYLATNTQAGNFITLGQLKANSGQQVYDITGMPDFTQYKFVLIWCQQFNILFGSAQLN